MIVACSYRDKICNLVCSHALPHDHCECHRVHCTIANGNIGCLPEYAVGIEGEVAL